MKSTVVAIAHSLRMYLVLTVLLGLVYPFLVYGIGQLFFSAKANGSLIRVGDVVIGSKLIAQKTVGAIYFWPRPSAVDYNPLGSGGSNLGPTSEALRVSVDNLKSKFAGNMVPAELLFASGSGLDPEISYAAAIYQASRIANARGVDVDKVLAMVSHERVGRQLGFLGEETVNVLMLNLAMDRELPQRK